MCVCGCVVCGVVCGGVCVWSGCVALCVCIMYFTVDIFSCTLKCPVSKLSSLSPSHHHTITPLTPSQFFMSLAALTVLIVHLFTKPYEQMYINVIEAAILLNLLMVTAAFLNPSNSPVPVWFSTLLVLLPYFYAIGYLGYVIVRKIW